MIAGLVNPFAGFLAYVALAVLKPDALWFWSVPQSNFSRLVALSMLAGWTIRGFGDWNFGRGRIVILSLIGYWMWAALGYAFASDKDVAWRFVDSLTKIALPCLVGITTVTSVDQLKQLAWVIVGCEGYVALEFNRAYLQGYNMIKEAGFAGMDNNSVSIGLVACAGLAFFLGSNCVRVWQKALAFGAAMLMAHAVMLSDSRGGMLGLVITGAVAFLIIPKQPKHFFLVVVAVLLMLRMAGPAVRARFSTAWAGADKRDASADSRLKLWRACGDLMSKHPLLGVGPDHFPLVVHEYGWPKGKEAHSLWMQIGAELGLPGLGLLLSYFGFTISRLWRIARGRVAVHDPWLRHLAQMVIASTAGYAVSAQFVSLEALEPPYYIAMMGSGVLALIARRAAPATAHAGRRFVLPSITPSCVEPQFAV